MTHQTDIKTLKDGSIDYAHYIANSHEIRSNDAHQALAAIGWMFQAIWASMTPRLGLHRGPSVSQTERYTLDRAAHRTPNFRDGNFQDKTTCTHEITNLDELMPRRYAAKAA
jgi:hypothetical protein